MNYKTEILYRVNYLDEIVFVNEDWDIFATANGAPHLLSKNIIGKLLWQFVTDETTSQLYREMIHRARGGQIIQFNFRCDAPDLRRFLEMSIKPAGENVQFETRALRLESRPAQTLLKSDVPRAGGLLSICGWCKKVEVGKEMWEEVENAVSLLNLFETEGLPPQLTHGICKVCYQAMIEKLSVRRTIETI